MTPQAEFGPDVFHPTDEDYDPDRVIRDAARNALIAKGAALTTACGMDYSVSPIGKRWYVNAEIQNHTNSFFGANLADALIALAEACDAA